MSRTTGSDDVGRFQSAGRGRGAHEVHQPAVPAQKVDEIAREEMADYSPDGRVPDRAAKGRGKTAFWLILLIGLPLVLATVIYIGGVTALLMGIVYVVVFAAVAFPVWYAGLMRKREENEAHEIVKETLSEEEDRKGRAA